MKTVSTQIKYLEKASRLELIIRFIWMIPSVIVLLVFGLFAAVCFVLQWLYILFVGRRSRSLHAIIKTYIVQKYRIESYFILLTDERSPIVPELEKV
jgi:cellulose synthase/poly-beta-1,6-N-acetylglucosamine synthase-like glycosyltransferase